MSPASRRGAPAALALAGVLALAGCSGGGTGGSGGDGADRADGPAVPSPSSPSTAPGDGDAAGSEGPPAPAVPEPAPCPPATARVSDAEQLEDALASAAPGDVIHLADGTYTGSFTATASGTAQEPVHLCGGRGAVLDGGGPEEGYVVHLDGASHWRLVGFTVRNGQKGVMADGTTGSVVQDLAVTDIGDEAIHLRRASTGNLVVGNEVSRTGLREPKFGEGVYVGTAESNWCDVSGCEPDRSDGNVVRDNDFRQTSAEAVDVKEGTTGGLIVGNTFDGSGTTGADSWVDVKGNDWVVEANRGTDAPHDGFQTHEILDGWGDRNTFRANVATVNAEGHGFSLTPERRNVVTCDNTVQEAGGGLATTACRD